MDIPGEVEMWGGDPVMALRPLRLPSHPPASSGLTSTTSLAPLGDSQLLAVRVAMSASPMWTNRVEVMAGAGPGWDEGEGWGRP